jgi:putative phosphoesterase
MLGMFADDPVIQGIDEAGRRSRAAGRQQARRDAARYRPKVMAHQTIQIDCGTIGVISDTHGLMRPEALAALKGAAWIIHAGDIGSVEVLQALQEIAPVTAVRGNNDKGAWADALPETTVVEVGAGSIYVLHDVKSLGRRPQLAGFRAVIAGHSHRPQLEERDGVLFLNPGSAGPRRFKLPVSVARLHIQPDAWHAELVTLTV